MLFLSSTSGQRRLERQKKPIAGVSRETLSAVASCFVTLTLLATGAARADWRDDVTVFRVGVMAGSNAPYRLVQLEPFKEYLESRLALPVEIVPADDFAALIAAQMEAGVDYAIESATAYVTAKTRCDCVEAVAVPTRAGGEAGFHALLVAKSDDDIETLADAEGARLALAGSDSVAGRLLQMKAFEDEGIDPETYFSEVVEVADPAAAISALLADEADLAVAWSSLAGNRTTGFSFGVLSDLVAAGELSMYQVNVVWQSALIPFGPHAIRSSLPDELKELVSKALLAMSREAPAAYDAVDRNAGRGFVAADADLFAPISALIAPSTDAARP